MHPERFGRSFPLHAISKPRAHQNTANKVETRRWLFTGNQHKSGGLPVRGTPLAVLCPLVEGAKETVSKGVGSQNIS